MKKNTRGFSLIELLIVVAIILIIAAIAIPNLLRSRIAANEASAVGSVRTINTAEITYASTYPDVGFALLPALGPTSAGVGGTSANSGLIDSVLASGTKTGVAGLGAARQHRVNQARVGGGAADAGRGRTQRWQKGEPNVRICGGIGDFRCVNGADRTHRRSFVRGNARAQQVG